MSKYAKLGEILRQVSAESVTHMPLINAEVVSIQGESCTVKIGDDLEVDEVRLKATINGSTNKVLIQPKIGSMVLIGSLTGDLKDLAVLSSDEVEKLKYEQDGLTIEVDSIDKKVKVSNTEVSLYGLFQSLTSLLKQFKVYTPSGPSGNPLPPTIQAINELETDFKKILK